MEQQILLDLQEGTEEGEQMTQKGRRTGIVCIRICVCTSLFKRFRQWVDGAEGIKGDDNGFNDDIET